MTTTHVVNVFTLKFQLLCFLPMSRARIFKTMTIDLVLYRGRFDNDWMIDEITYIFSILKKINGLNGSHRARFFCVLADIFMMHCKNAKMHFDPCQFNA
jgi:hypothetical protein